MIKFFIKVFTILLFLLSILEPSRSQDFTLVSKQDQLFGANVMSPQSFSFLKQGRHEMSLFNGQVMLNVPIYTYQDKDFTIPLSLTYNSSGFMPNQREGIIGLDWSLNAGACITRVVNGVPDDSNNGQDPTGYYELNGLFYGIKNNLAIKSTSKSDIFNLIAGSIPITFFWNISTCEVEPDLFSFNVPGLSGRFYIENNGEARTIGNKPFKVDLSGVAIQNLQGSPQSDIANSSILITTDDGFKYYFGGDISKLDVVFSLTESNEVLNPTINTWHLTKIVAPSGQVVEYKYKTFITGIHHYDDPNDPYHYLLNVNHLRYSEGIEDAMPGGEFYSGGASGLVTSKSVTKTTFLEEILVTGKASIKFSYIENENLFYKDTDYLGSKFNKKSLRINKIEIQDYLNNKTKDFEFVQTYYGGVESRFFLTSFKASGESSYTFTYYNTSNLPSPLTAGVDHWGFWNGNSNVYGATIPASTFSLNGDVVITGTERDPDITKCKTAILRRITYPTSGYSEFDYEAHAYSSRLERKNDFNFLSKLYPVSGNVGGSRIAKVTDFDGVGLTNIREFKYTKNYPSSSVSSGTLLKWPRYFFYWENTVPGSGTSKHLKMKSSSFNNTYSGTDNFIQYSEVTEITNGNGYTNYLYTDYNSNPDENDYHTKKLDPTAFDGISNINLLNSYAGIYFNDKYFERGVAKDIRQYRANANNTYSLVKETKTNSFTGLSDFPDLYVAGAHITGSIVQSFKKYYYPFLPKQVEETTYGLSENETVKLIHNYDYNANGYLIKETTIQSNGDLLSSVVSYPNDYSAGTTFLDDMKTNNLLKYPIEKIQFKEINGSKFITSGQITQYLTSGKGQIDKTLGLKLSSKIPLANFKFSNRSLGILPPSGTVSTFSPDVKYEVKMVADSYDAAGNVSEYHKDGDIPQSAIWDYNAAYLVCQVTNASQNSIAYTSFETESKGNWIYNDVGRPQEAGSITGKRYLSFNSRDGNTMSRSNLQIGKQYVISYWSKQNAPFTISGGTSTHNIGTSINGWIFHKHIATASSATITITGDGAIDEVRLYPVEARMTTYAYNPLIGMSEQCDINDKITFYEYDNYSRLSIVRDEERNILKRICYKYSGQPEGCGSSSLITMNVKDVTELQVKERESLTVTFSIDEALGSGANVTWSFAGLPNFVTINIGYRIATLSMAPDWGWYGNYTVTAEIFGDQGPAIYTRPFVIKVIQTPITDPNSGTLPPAKAQGFAAGLQGIYPKLTWENRSYNATAIQIYRANTLAGPYAVVNSAAPNATEFTDTAVLPNTSYFYFIRVVNPYGATNTAVVKVTTPP